MKNWIPCLVVFSLAGGACWYAAAVTQPSRAAVDPSQIVPKDCVVFVQCDGLNDHLPAAQETAKWQAFDKSGLRARIFDLLEVLASSVGQDAGRLARASLDNLHQRGLSMGMALTAEDEPLQLSPYGVVVFHGAGELKHDLMSVLFKMDRSIRQSVQTRAKAGRQLTIASPPNAPMPGLEIALWAEGEHLVLAAGVNASDRVIATLEGELPNITENERYNSLRNEGDVTVSQLSWIDFEMLVASMQTLPLPPLPSGEPADLQQFLQILGLDNLEAVTMRSGYQGKATWDRLDLIAAEPRRGLLALVDQRMMTLEDLPPLPPKSNGFMAGTFNIPKAVDVLLETVRSGLQLVEPDALEQVDQGLEQFRFMLGEPRDVLSAGLGDVFCVYSEPGMLPFGISPVITASVADRQKLTGSLDMLSQIAQTIPDLREVTIRKQNKDSGTWYTIVIPNSPVVPTILVTDDWFLVSLTPGAAQGLVKRAAGDLPSWEPSPEHQEALAELPEEFSSITVMDPRPSYEQLFSFVPVGLSLLETTALPELSRETGRDLQMPFGIEDVPVPDEVTGPMFPNISMGFTTAQGATSITRSSVPANPVGSVGTTATVPVLIGLLLPAVQQSREAARRTQSRNNLKQIGLAMHNYHDVYRHFPGGLVENDALETEERLSWAVSILPYIDQANLYNLFDMEAGWADQQENVTAINVIQYMNPSMVAPNTAGGRLDYLAVAGVGKDAAVVNDQHAGVFGYNRKTRIRDITDGTSNTMLVGDAQQPVPYAHGHRTIQAFTEQPYINGPDGFGSHHPGGMQILMADGSVRFISEWVDPTIVEALATKAGGEIIRGDEF